MIESSRIPRGRAVTGLTSLRESGLRVRGVRGFVEVVQVATDASGWRVRVVAADVASRAVEGCVGPGQCEASELEVIELSAKPVIHAMTLGAVGGKLQLCMIRLRRLKVLRMAAVAIRRHGGVVTEGPILMTGIAIDCGVRA